MPTIVPILLIVSIPMLLLGILLIRKLVGTQGPEALVIPPSTALIMMKEQRAVLIDVRSEAEHKWEHIPGDVLIPLADLVEEVQVRFTDKKQPLILYCRSGRRSAIGGEQLLRLGYEEIFDAGGIESWEGEKTGDRYRAR